MDHSNTLYWVEVKENDGKWRIVPHSNKEIEGQRPYKFMNRKKAESFRNDLKEGTPDHNFRLVKFTETYKFEKPV